jgi:hypothetical protein
VSLTLLGPQRRASAARTAVAELIPYGQVAAVNAGWLERESDTGELDDVLGGRLVNLELYRRYWELREADPGLDRGEWWLTERLDELRTAYRLRLHPALAAVGAVRQQVRDEQVRADAEEDGVAAVRALDAWHLARSEEARQQWADELAVGERASVLRHRQEVAGLLSDSAGLVVAGGHVGVLVHLLRLFGVADLVTELVTRPLITWSAGAMALSEQVVLFHDHPTFGERPPEVYAVGLGAYPGVIPFAHARRRLRLDDRDHVALLVRRLLPRTAVLLADGARVDLRPGAPLAEQVPRLSTSGVVVTGAAPTGADRGGEER